MRVLRLTPQLCPKRSGNLAVLRISNPEALNALTLEMIYCMQDMLNEWFSPGGPKAILLKTSAETKAPCFCAGGDVKRVYEAALADRASGAVVVGQGHGISAEFFRQEYYVNHKLATASTSWLESTRVRKDIKEDSSSSPDPTVVSFLDGFVMGGGVGISIYGKYQVATERTVWSMPETGIGLFPDVGSLYWMPRLLSPHEGMAVYLALTGRRLQADDLIFTGLATHYVKSDQLSDLEDAMADALLTSRVGDTATDPLADTLSLFHTKTRKDPRKSPIAKDSESIKKFFGHCLSNDHQMEDIMHALQTDAGEFATETAATLLEKSPTSLKITLEGLRRATRMSSIAEDLQMEFRLGQGCLRVRENGQVPDFYEGVRAALVDKDKKPQWQPARLEDVSADYMESFFEPVEQEWEPPSAVTKTTVPESPSSKI